MAGPRPQRVVDRDQPGAGRGDRRGRAGAGLVRTRPRPVRGDPARAEEILAASGFAEVGFTDVDEPIYYGPDPSVAYDFVLGLRDPKDVLARMDAETAEHARDRLRATLEEHATRDGVFFGSRAWIITARRPGTPRYLPQ